MQNPSAPVPVAQDLVLLGGGHAHALVLRAWGMDPVPGVAVTLVNPDPVAPYTGMLPGLVAGHYRRDEIMIDLVRLAAQTGARLILDRATGIDPAARQVMLEGRGALAYDLLSVDIGIGSGLPDLPGFADHATAAKPLGPYAARWEAFLARAPEAPRVVVIGGGIGGVELALASAHRLRAAGRRGAVVLVEQGPAVLPLMGAAARRRLLGELAAAQVQVLTGAAPQRIAANAVHLQDGRRIDSDFTVSAAGARPQAWLRQTGLALHEGYLAVGPTLQTSDPAVFAAGDCAHMTHAPRPKAGVFAVRAAPVLHHNLRAALAGRPLRAFRPQADFLKLVSLGDRRALADRRLAGVPVVLRGAWAWRWKDRIDRAFMDRFAPRRPVPGAARAPCAGCGAKLGAGALDALAAALPRPARADVLAGPGDDAALLAAGGGMVQAITTDHLRWLVADEALMARLAAVHALGDIWAMGAAPQAALAQVILPQLSPELEARRLASVMSAAAAVFRDAGADVAGGHSSAGAEPVTGFAVTGLLPQGRALTKAGAQPGDALVLTKPLGSGTIFAALMADAAVPAGLILGECVAAALRQMLRPMTADAAVLAPVARAMTDVTGFGLAGHLWEMARAAGCGAEVALSCLPLLPGAEALAAAGEASTLAPLNRAALSGHVRGEGGPRAALMFDPQTCGGLLAAVPCGQVAEVMAALAAAGVPAARIGQITEAPPQIVLRP